MSRVSGPEVTPVEFEGRRYAQIIDATLDGFDQRTGYLAITDIASGQRVATIKAYAVAFDPDEEADVQDVFFTRLTLDQANRRLIVESERG